MRLRWRIAAFGAAVVGLTGAVMAVIAGSAFAHEDVKVGNVDFEIGFANEPVYAGFQNAVFLFAQGENGMPITNAADTLKVEVVFGDQREQFPLEPNFDVESGGKPGQYLARFIPSRPGKYTFHLFGSIGGQKINRTFTSSPSTFDEAVDPSAVEFPIKDPTPGQLAERIDREIPRLTAAVATARSEVEDKVDAARTLAISGMILGAVGLLLAVLALSGWRAAARRSTPPVSAGRGEESPN